MSMMKDLALEIAERDHKKMWDGDISTGVLTTRQINSVLRHLGEILYEGSQNDRKRIYKKLYELALHRRRIRERILKVRKRDALSRQLNRI